MISFEEAKRHNGSFRKACDAVERLIQIADLIPQVIEYYRNPLEKNESNNVEYQYRESVVERTLFRDRSQPVDTVILNDFKNKTGADIESARIEYGPNSDEYTRSHHALAIAIANTIYFRNGAYKPETEEGRKLLAHELTHITQNKEKESYRNKSVDEKEKEAEENEQTQEYNSDTLVKKTIGGKEYLLKLSVWEKIYSNARKILEDRIITMSDNMPQEDFLKLLYQYEKWENKEELKCQPQ